MSSCESGEIEITNPKSSAMIQVSDEEDDDIGDLVVKETKRIEVYDRKPETPEKNHYPIELPTFSIPQFDGSPDEWFSFYHIFKSLIHENKQLSNVHKFLYLRQYLIRPALGFISYIPINAENYERAWNIIVDHYYNKRLMIHKHMTSLFNLEPVKEKSSSELQRLFWSAQNHVWSLKELGQPTEHWDLILIHLVTTKFDEETLKKWHNHCVCDLNDIATFNDLKEFIMRRCKIMDIMAIHRNDEEVKTNHRKNVIMRCYKCKGSHAVYRCQQFICMDVSDRIKFIRSINACLNCLRKGHQNNMCYSRNCKFCHEHHHTLLCEQSTLS